MWTVPETFGLNQRVTEFRLMVTCVGDNYGDYEISHRAEDGTMRQVGLRHGVLLNNPDGFRDPVVAHGRWRNDITISSAGFQMQPGCYVATVRGRQGGTTRFERCTQVVSMKIQRVSVRDHR